MPTTEPTATITRDATADVAQRAAWSALWRALFAERPAGQTEMSAPERRADDARPQEAA